MVSLGRALRWPALHRGIALVALACALVPIVLSRPVPLMEQPFPDAPTYADTAFQIANGNGFGTVIDERVQPEQAVTNLIRPSRYPPGYPLALAPFVALGENDRASAQTGARWIAGLLVVSLFFASFVLGGPLAATLAALVSVSSPFAETSSRLVMSDAFGAALTLLVIAVVGLAWRAGSWGRLRSVLLTAAGALAAFGVVARLSAVGMLASVVLTARHRRLMTAVAVGALPALIFVATYQWTAFGSPLRSGYSYYLPDVDTLSPSFVLAEWPRSERQFIFRDRLDGALMRWTCPCDEFGPMGKANNAVFYPAVLLGFYWVYYPPLFSLLGLWEMLRRRSSPVAQLSALIVVTNVALFLPYLFQGARFVAPAAYVLLVFSAVGAARVLKLVPEALRWATARLARPGPRQDALAVERGRRGWPTASPGATVPRGGSSGEGTGGDVPGTPRDD